VTQTGKKYMKSPLSGQWHIVTEWENVDGKPGRHIAKEKKPVEADKVPDEIKEELDEVADSD